MDLAALAGTSYGPHPFHVSFGNVADFVDATDGDPSRWGNAAPPGFIAAALFVVAPDLLGQLSDRSVIHGEQSFAWHRPIEIGSELSVTGDVSRVRERGGVHFVGFDLGVSDARGSIAAGSSLFLISGESNPGVAAEERSEPLPGDRGNPVDGQIAASRGDLIRYAAATRDWNPLHWDHASAVDAGLAGVVTHGLLQASWAFMAAADLVDGDRPLETAKVRFRNPLLPAVPVSVSLEQTGTSVSASVADDELEYISASIELAGQ